MSQITNVHGLPQSAIGLVLTGHHKARFWTKVNRKDDTECWEWLGNLTHDGYGTFDLPSSDGRWRSRRAHRVAFVIANGELEDGMMVCHTCDNPSCCNPAHLFAGTQAENMADMWRKGRRAIGEKQGSAKLKEADVIAIRVLLASGISHKKIADQYGVARSTITDINLRKKWKHMASIDVASDNS